MLQATFRRLANIVAASTAVVFNGQPVLFQVPNPDRIKEMNVG